MSDVHFIDWIILLACLVAGVGGYRLGFITRALSWLGLLLGMVIAVALLPAVLRNAHNISSLDRMGVVIVLMLLGSLLGQLLGLYLGSKASSTLSEGNARKADHVAGAFAGIVGVLVVLWVVLPIAANIPGWSAQQVRNSVIARSVYNNTPELPNAMQALQRLVGANNFPSVFEGIGPTEGAGPPPEDVTLSAEALQAAKASTVKIEGNACHRTQDGSGFVVSPNLVVTNAHVVAGESKTTVIGLNNQKYSSTVVAFDPERDLALLEVVKLDAPSLPVGDASINETGAVFGHPGGQDEIAVSPAKVERQIVAVGRDLYDRQTTRREVLILAATLRPGDSGGPLVSSKGEVIGVAFAIAPDRPDTAYALDTSELQAVLRKPHTEAVDTGPCLRD